LIGRKLSAILTEKGYNVSILSRTLDQNINYPVYLWDPEKNRIDPEAVRNSDHIIHLAGAGIGDKRWTPKRKKEIIESRTKSGRLLLDSVLISGIKIKTFISASATGYYGSKTSDSIFNEDYEPAKDFTGEVCRLWENAADRFAENGVRTVKIRTGIVLSSEGGALNKMIMPVKLGFGSSIGTGRQYLPWIHIDDLCNIYVKAIEDIKMKGAFNATAPDFITYSDFISVSSRILGKTLWAPDIPRFIIRLAFGEMSVILLEGSKVSCEKIIAGEFQFKFPDLESALRDILKI